MKYFFEMQLSNFVCQQKEKNLYANSFPFSIWLQHEACNNISASPPSPFYKKIIPEY